MYTSISFCDVELEEALRANMLLSLIRREVFKVFRGSDFFDELCSNVHKVVSEAMAKPREDRPENAQLLTVGLTLPEPGRVGYCAWSQGVFV